MTLRFYGRQGEEIDLLTWQDLRHEPSYLEVGLTDVGPFTVSTVWVGLDSRDPPRIFETIVFNHATFMTRSVERWLSLSEAEAEHWNTVAAVKKDLYEP